MDKKRLVKCLIQLTDKVVDMTEEQIEHMFSTSTSVVFRQFVNYDTFEDRYGVINITIDEQSIIKQGDDGRYY